MKSALLLALLLPSAAPAQDAVRAFPMLPGRFFVENCQPPADRSQPAGMIPVCAGFIEGVIDTHLMIYDALHLQPWICVPRSVRTEEMMEAIVAHIRAHPESADFNAASVVLGVLKDRYPCPRSPN